MHVIFQKCNIEMKFNIGRIWVKQHLSNIWSSIHVEVKHTETELKRRRSLYKNHVYGYQRKLYKNALLLK